MLKNCGKDLMGEEYIYKHKDFNIYYFVRKIKKIVVEKQNYEGQLLVILSIQPL